MDFDPNALPIPALGLVCRQCGYLLDHLPSHRCPECGWQFALDDLLPPGDFPIMTMDGLPVVLTQNVGELLKSARILHVPFNGPLESVYGLPKPITGRQWFRVARSEFLYLLHLLRNPDLPLPPQASGPDWICPGCKESNPGTFDLCWSCGKSGPSPDK